MEIKIDFFEMPMSAANYSTLPFQVPQTIYGYLYDINPLTGYEDKLVGILNPLTDKSGSIDTNHLFFGEVICPYLPFRGKYACKKLNSISREMEIESLPQFRYNNSIGDCFLLAKGEYYLLAAQQVKCEEVAQLEYVNHYAENLLRLRFVVEVFKQYLITINLSYEEIFSYCYDFYCSDYANRKLARDELKYGLEMLLPQMLSIPQRAG